MTDKPTCEQIARSWELWVEYVDPDAVMMKEEFDALSIFERIATIVGTFGEEQEVSLCQN